MTDTRAQLRELSGAAQADATAASGRGDKEGSMYARGLRDAYATAATFVPQLPQDDLVRDHPSWPAGADTEQGK